MTDHEPQPAVIFSAAETASIARSPKKRSINGEPELSSAIGALEHRRKKKNGGNQKKNKKELDRQAFVDEKGPIPFQQKHVVKSSASRNDHRSSYRRMGFIFFKVTKEKKS